MASETPKTLTQPKTKIMPDDKEKPDTSPLIQSPDYVLMVERGRQGIGFFKSENLYLGIVTETVDIEQARLFSLDDAEAMIARISKDDDATWGIFRVKLGRILDGQNDRWKKKAQRKELEAKLKEVDASILSHNA